MKFVEFNRMERNPYGRDVSYETCGVTTFDLDAVRRINKGQWVTSVVFGDADTILIPLDQYEPLRKLLMDRR